MCLNEIGLCSLKGFLKLSKSSISLLQNFLKLLQLLRNIKGIYKANYILLKVSRKPPTVYLSLQFQKLPDMFLMPFEGYLRH